jgi:hypothetical protein
MRLYEHIASHYVDVIKLDQLTKDTSEAVARDAQLNKPDSERFLDMFVIQTNARFIGYLADFSVHWIILMYGYYEYMQHRRQQLRKVDDVDEEAETVAIGITAVFSCTKKSALLALSRALCLIFSSAGASVGCLLTYPKLSSIIWGQAGDGIAMSLADTYLVAAAPRK